MGTIRKAPPKNDSHSENCVTNELSTQKKKAIANLQKCKDYEKGRKFKYIPHPNTFRALIRVEVFD